MSKPMMEGDDVINCMNRITNLQQNMTSISPNGSIAIDDFVVAAVITNLPLSWALVTHPLEF